MSEIYGIEPVVCSLSITNNALKGIEQWFPNEQSFIASEPCFDVHIEKKPVNRKGNHSYAFFFDPKTNPKLAGKVSKRVAVMECILKPDGLLATGFHMRGKKESVRTNRRLQVRMDFKLNRNGLALPVDLHMKLRGLPVAAERSEYVKKRIESWEGYLQIAEKNADVEDLHGSFSSVSFSNDFAKAQLTCSGLKAKNWKQLKGFSVKAGELEIGQVIDADKSRSRIEIELSRHVQKSVRSSNRLPGDSNKLSLSNFASLSQIRRLKKGFKDLQDGLAANANLEKLLFEERPVVRINNKNPELEFHNTLNEYQRQAVTGAMKASDLYVIQGPPGTGKTTVISEICYQNVKAGLRTLVASQSNLAVDNALGRLMADPSIRILRYGRTESIEEEGKKFIEENVALHWRDVTLENIQENRQSLEELAAELSQKISRLEEEQISLHDQKQDLENQLHIQEALQQKAASMAEELSALETKLADVRQLISRNEASIHDLSRKIETAVERKAELQASLANLDEQKLQNEQAEWLQKLEALQEMQTTLQMKEELNRLEETLGSLAEQHGKNQEEQARLKKLKNDLPSIKKLSKYELELKAGIVELPLDITLNISELKRLSHLLRDKGNSDSYQDWKQLHDRLEQAIQTAEQELKKHRYPLEQIVSRPTARFKTLADIHDMIDRLARFLITPATKQALASPDHPPEKVETLEKIAKSLSLFYSKRADIVEQGLIMKEQQQLRSESVQLFAAIKADTDAYLTGRLKELSGTENSLEQQLQELQEEQAVLSSLLAKRLTVSSSAELSETVLSRDIDTTRASIDTCTQQLKQIQHLKEALREAVEQLDSMEQQLLNKQEQLAQAQDEEHILSEQQTPLQTTIKEIEAQIDPNLPERLHQLAAEIEKNEQLLTQWKTEQRQLPIKIELQQEWETLLKEASEYDLNEIRKLYVEHANVIGTTCVASAAKTFMEDYPEFDVVIIDEVSKATPPELLLPMLKGKKIILVGDHHQLPPLIGQETMDEFLGGLPSDQQKEMKKLLQESLFERLYRTLPKQNKTMLSIQYRMHEQIMETIAPFYQNGCDQLLCGLQDSDALRDHQLDCSAIRRSDHLIWLDTPNEAEYFEAKPKGGTSRYNESELKLIARTLEDLDAATAEAKACGRIEPDEKKSVGVISFYGEQVKRINHLIEQELRPKQLHVRTGSVDKFQGMEMDVIIVSFVRNHDDKSGDIGFAKDYRRLNVALSRSKELLIIVGSSEMFTARTKHAASREMYSRLLETVKQCGGLRNSDLMKVR